MSKTENIHVGLVSEYKQNKAIIRVAGKDYHVSLTKEDSHFLEDILYNFKLNHIAFDIANETIISYDSFRQTYDEATSKRMYIAFITMFNG